MCCPVNTTHDKVFAYRAKYKIKEALHQFCNLKSVNLGHPVCGGLAIAAVTRGWSPTCGPLLHVRPPLPTFPARFNLMPFMMDMLYFPNTQFKVKETAKRKMPLSEPIELPPISKCQDWVTSSGRSMIASSVCKCSFRGD